MKTIVCQGDKVQTLIDLKRDGKLKHTSHVIYFDEVQLEEAAREVGITLIRFNDAVKEGMELSNMQWDPVTGDTFYTFSYTSGTTGMPKGVMLTHRNLVSNLGGVDNFDGEFCIKEDDVYLSYLPLAHVLERFLYLLTAAY